MDRAGNFFSALDDGNSEEMSTSGTGTVETPVVSSTTPLIAGGSSATSITSLERFTLPSKLGKIQLSRTQTPENRASGQSKKTGKPTNIPNDLNRDKPEGKPKGYQAQSNEFTEKDIAPPPPEFTAKLTDILPSYAAPDDSLISASPSSTRGVSSSNKIADTIWELTKTSKIRIGGSYWAVSGIPTVREESTVDPNLINGLVYFFEEHFLQITRDAITAAFRDPSAVYTMDHCTTSTYFFPLDSPTVFSQFGIPILGEDGKNHYINQQCAVYTYQNYVMVGQCSQFNGMQLRAMIGLGIVRNIPTSPGGIQWSLSAAWEWVKLRLRSTEFVLLLLVYSPMPWDKKFHTKFSYHEPMLQVLVPPMLEDQDSWTRRLRKALFGQEDFIERYTWMGVYPIQVQHHAQCFASMHNLILHDALLAHRVITIDVEQLPPTATFDGILDTLVRNLPEGAIVGATFVPPLLGATNPSSVWVILHPRYFSQTLSSRVFHPVSTSIIVKAAPVLRIFLFNSQTSLRIHSGQINSSAFDLRNMQWKSTHIKESIVSSFLELTGVPKNAMAISCLTAMVGGDTSFIKPTAGVKIKGNHPGTGPITSKKAISADGTSTKQSSGGHAMGKGATIGRLPSERVKVPSGVSSTDDKLSELEHSQGGMQVASSPITTSNEKERITFGHETIASEGGGGISSIKVIPGTSEMAGVIQALQERLAKCELQLQTLTKQGGQLTADIGRIDKECARIGELDARIEEIKSTTSTVSSLTGSTEEVSLVHQIGIPILDYVAPFTWIQLMLTAVMTESSVGPSMLRSDDRLLERLMCIYHGTTKRKGIPNPKLTEGLSESRLRNMVSDLLMYRGIPRRLVTEFAEATSAAECRRLSESPLSMDHAIETWASQFNKTLEGEELITGVALLLNRVDPNAPRNIRAYASAFIDRYPAVTVRRGLNFWNTTIHHYQQLSAVGKEDLVILTRVKERDSLRETRRDLVLHLRTKLIENQLFTGENGEARIYEFIGKNLVGVHGLNLGQEWLQNEAAIDEALQRYLADHYPTPGSAFAARTDEDPNPVAYPFWTCAGGCLTVITSSNSRLCVDCGRACCMDNECVHSSSPEPVICHCCVSERLGYTLSGGTAQARRRSKNKDKFEAQIWEQLVSRNVSPDQIHGLTKEVLGNAPEKLSASLDTILGPLPPNTPQAPSPSEPGNKARRAGGSNERVKQVENAGTIISVARTLDTEVDQPPGHYEEPDDDSLNEVFSPDREPGPVQKLGDIKHHLKFNITRRTAAAVDEIVAEAERDPVYQERLNILVVGSRPFKAEALQNLSREQLIKADTQTAICYLAMEPLTFSSGCNIYSWGRDGAGPNHIAAEFKAYGAELLAGLLGERKVQLDLILFYPTSLAHSFVKAFMEPDGPYHTLIKLRKISGGILLPSSKTPKDQYGHLRGAVQVVHMDGYIWSRAEQVCSRLLNLFGLSIPQSKYGFAHWYYFVEGGVAEPIPREIKLASPVKSAVKRKAGRSPNISGGAASSITNPVDGEKV